MTFPHCAVFILGGGNGKRARFVAAGDQSAPIRLPRVILARIGVLERGGDSTSVR